MAVAVRVPEGAAPQADPELEELELLLDEDELLEDELEDELLLDEDELDELDRERPESPNPRLVSCLYSPRCSRA
jgi:hypothetical protein